MFQNTTCRKTWKRLLIENKKSYKLFTISGINNILILKLNTHFLIHVLPGWKKWINPETMMSSRFGFFYIINLMMSRNPGTSHPIVNIFILLFWLMRLSFLSLLCQNGDQINDVQNVFVLFVSSKWQRSTTIHWFFFLLSKTKTRCPCAFKNTQLQASISFSLCIVSHRNLRCTKIIIVITNFQK